jgi:hypothetical protein
MGCCFLWSTYFCLKTSYKPQASSIRQYMLPISTILDEFKTQHRTHFKKDTHMPDDVFFLVLVINSVSYRGQNLLLGRYDASPKLLQLSADDLK